MKQRQEWTKKIKESSRFEEEVEKASVVLGEDCDLEATAKEFDNNFSIKIGKFPSFNESDNDKVSILSEFGFPQEYIEDSIVNNDPNYCTAGYYLLGMDQHYC